jgi:hypothetical protein
MAVKMTAEEKKKSKARSAKKQRVTREEKRLRLVYAKLPKDAAAIADGLIRRAAHMRITLEDYEVDLDDKGAVEMFSQSDKAAAYERERPVARLYNSLNKNYQSIIKQLSDMLPKVDPLINLEADDGFDAFTNKR